MRPRRGYCRHCLCARSPKWERKAKLVFKQCYIFYNFFFLFFFFHFLAAASEGFLALRACFAAGAAATVLLRVVALFTGLPSVAPSWSAMRRVAPIGKWSEGNVLLGSPGPCAVASAHPGTCNGSVLSENNRQSACSRRQHHCVVIIAQCTRKSHREQRHGSQVALREPDVIEAALRVARDCQRSNHNRRLTFSHSLPCQSAASARFAQQARRGGFRTWNAGRGPMAPSALVHSGSLPASLA